MTEKPNQPFTTPLVDSRLYENDDGRFSEFENNPDYIIRAKPLESLKGICEFQGLLPSEAIQIGRKLFEELEQRYAIPVPAKFIVRKDEKGADTLYTLTALIKGYNLPKTLERLPIDQDLINEGQALFASLARYMLDKTLSDDYFLTDIGTMKQYVYGRKGDEEKKHMYLVDTDIYFSKDLESLSESIRVLMNDIEEFESATGTACAEARQILSTFFSEKAQ